MKRQRWSARLLAVLLLTCGGASADEPRASSRPSTSPTTQATQPAEADFKGVADDRYAGMLALPGVTTEQKAQLGKKVRDLKAAIDKWGNGNTYAEKDAESLKAYNAAKNEKNVTAMVAAMNKRRTMKKQYEELLATHHAGILAVLTKEQADAWTQQELYAAVTARIPRGKLSANQRADIKQLCSQYAEDYSAAGSARARKRVLNKLNSEIAANVLTTAEQRERAAKVKEAAEKRRAEAKAAREKNKVKQPAEKKKGKDKKAGKDKDVEELFE